MERMMATFLRSMDHTDPRRVAVAWQDALTAMGWEQTEDTGQLDPVTEPFPSGQGSTWGFQCWRPGDGLDGLILKIVWWRYSSTAYPGVNFEIGAETDGVGEFVGPTWFVSANGSPANNSQTLMMGGDSSGFYAAMGYNNDGSSSSQGLRGALIVDRARDANGEPTPDGAGFLHNLGSTSRMIRVGKPGEAAWTGGGSSSSSYALPLYPLFVGSESSTTGGSYSADDFSTPVFPSVLAGHGVPTWVSPLFVGVHPNDMPSGLTADIAGRSRHYRRVRTGPLGASNASPGLVHVTTNTGTGVDAWPMMLWED